MALPCYLPTFSTLNTIIQFNYFIIFKIIFFIKFTLVFINVVSEFQLVSHLCHTCVILVSHFCHNLFHFDSFLTICDIMRDFVTFCDPLWHFVTLKNIYFFCLLSIQIFWGKFDSWQNRKFGQNRKHLWRSSFPQFKRRKNISRSGWVYVLKTYYNVLLR